jgi:hypothetical protein
MNGYYQSNTWDGYLIWVPDELWGRDFITLENAFYYGCYQCND